MSGAERCDEIMRMIDEVLEPFGGVVVGEREPSPEEAKGADREWTGLVRWGALPQPVLATR